MPEAHADGYDEGEEDALVQGSAVLSLMLDASFSLLLSFHLHLILMTISILHTHTKRLFIQKEVFILVRVCVETQRGGLWVNVTFTFPCVVCIFGEKKE